jgi:hypothetical protein
MVMTVQQLIEILSKLPQNLEVKVPGIDYYTRDVIGAEVDKEFEEVVMIKPEEGW